MIFVSYCHRDEALKDRNPDASSSRNRALLGVLGSAVAGLEILDAGCGLGGFSASLSRANRVTAVDVNKRCLADVANRLGYVTHCFDLEDEWPLDAAAFDLVLFGDVLEHLFGTVHVLEEARRVVRPNGRIAVAVPNVGFWRRRFRLLLRGELKVEEDEHIRFFSPRSLARIGKSAGLELGGCRPYAWNGSGNYSIPVSIAWGFVALFSPR